MPAGRKILKSPFRFGFIEDRDVQFAHEDCRMSRNKITLLLGALLLLGLFLTYLNHFRNGFYFDDAHTISSNAHITDIRNLPSFFTDPATFSSLPANQAYRPIVTTLNAVDHWIGGGLNPLYFHISIFLSYVLLLLLLYFVFRRIFDVVNPHDWNPFVALAATAFYGFHTANAETINYIIGRGDSFSTLCVVASLLLYQIRATRRLHLYLITMILGIYTKQTGVTFVPLLFLYIWFFDSEERQSAKRKIWSAAIRTAPAFVVGAGLFLFNQLFMTPETTVSTNTTISRWTYLATQFHVVTHYLGNFILPVKLSADPDFVAIPAWNDGRVLFGMFVVLVLLAAAAVAFRNMKTRPITYGILWFFVALLPTSSVIPLYQLGNDHRTFFPYIGFVLAVACFFGQFVVRHRYTVARLPHLRFGVPFLVALLLAGHAYGTHLRNEVWSSGESLWFDVTKKSPKNGRGLMNYGLTQMQKGNYDVALEYYEMALELLPRYSYLHVNLAILKNAMGEPKRAEVHFKRALRFGPENPEVHYYYAQWLDRQGRADEALRLLESGLALSPGHTRIRALLESRQAQKVRTAESDIETLLARLEENPTPETYLDLSLAYYRAGRYQDCIDACLEALALRPDYALAYNNICSCHNKLGEWDKAIEACQKALEIAPDFSRAQANLKWALDEKAKE